MFVTLITTASVGEGTMVRPEEEKYTAFDCAYYFVQILVNTCCCANMISYTGEIITWLTAGGAIVQLIIVGRAILTRCMPRLRVLSGMTQGYDKIKVVH